MSSSRPPVRGAERFTRSFANHGEGPFWDSRGGRLLCMDVLAASVVAIDTEGGVRRYPVPSKAATVIRHRSGPGFVLATEHGLVLADSELATFEPLARVVLDPTVRTNDGGCDPLGSFVIGTMNYDGDSDKGAVYRVTPDGEVAQILSPVTISNGLQWSADGTRVFYIDTPTRRVDAFDVDDNGAWSNRRPHIEITDTPGLPDGMAIDEEGGLWVALWGAGAVNHYDTSGRLVDTISVPGVTQTSSCTFGGADRTVLFVTTSRQGLPDDREPDAGAVFAVEVGVRGAHPLEFAG
ncbi:gluconolaconase [Mycobacterium sp. AT1]|nr:gluconolaconase [Mycobacterium sp. AT1]